MLRKILRYSVLAFFMIFCLVISHVRAGEIEEEFLKEPLLPLRDALARGIEKNLDLQVVKLNIPINRENVTINDADFDPVLDASISSLEEEEPTGSVSFVENFELYRAVGADAGISKKFRFGLESRLSFETSRSMDNSPVDTLRPKYRDFLVLDLTQPLLRDFGTDINTADLQISQNQVRQSVYGYVEQAQGLGREIELAYYELSKGLEILRYRIKSRELAVELLEGNRKKFEAGVVPITEVQEAETAVASRDEQILFARQQLETASNHIKDLLEIRPGDPLYEEIFVTEKVARPEEPFPELETALAIALEKRPDFQQHKLEIANWDIRITYFGNQKLPRIDLAATLGANGLSGGSRPAPAAAGPVSSPYGGNYADALSGMADRDGYEWFVGLRLSYPLGNRAAYARYRRAEQEKRQAIYRLKRLEGTAETEVSNALVIIKRSIERVRVAERFEELAKTTLEQEMERLKIGLTDTFRILNFQDDLIEAHIRKVTALVDFNKGLANLYRAMGTNLERFNIVAKINTKEINYGK